MWKQNSLPHSHSLTAATGLNPMPNQESTNNLPDFQCCWKVRKKLDTTHYLLYTGGRGYRHTFMIARSTAPTKLLGIRATHSFLRSSDDGSIDPAFSSPFPTAEQ
jgi:hypothetical protein